MNAYLIDPASRTITQVDTDFSLQSIYGLLGCSWITTAARQANGDLMFVDDNVSDDEHEAFRIGSWEIYSKALMAGTNAHGETISPKAPIQVYDAQVSWLGTKMFEPNVAIVAIPENAYEDRLATSVDENLNWWNAFFKRNGIE